MGGQNQVNVTKAHQVQIFKKPILSTYAQKKNILGITGSQTQAEVTMVHQVQWSVHSFQETSIFD